MPLFKLWFLSALLFAIVFPRSAVVAEEVPDPPTASFTDETVRTWKDTSGEFTTQAVLVGVQKDIVSLRKKDDRTIQVPLSKLSKADRAYVQSKLKRTLSTAEKGIVGSWKMVFGLDPKLLKAELAKVESASAKNSLNEDYLVYQKMESIYEFREDGTGTVTVKFTPFDSGETLRQEGTWKLVDKGEKQLEFEMTDESGENAHSFAWISKDQFTTTIPPVAELPTFITGLHFHRIKDTPEP